jgi:hypothetical protein
MKLKALAISLLFLPLAVRAATGLNAALQLTNAAANQTYTIPFRSTLNDGGGGNFRVITDDGRATNNVTVFRSVANPNLLFIRQFNESEGISVRWAGAKGDGTTDDTAAIQAAVNVAASLSVPIVFPAGNYKITSTISIPGTINVKGSDAKITAVGDFVALQYGSTTNNSLYRTLLLPQVWKSARTWAGPDVGVRLLNLAGCDVHVPAIYSFSVGLDAMGINTNGWMFNTVRIGYISDALTNLWLHPVASGWVNDNTFIGGSLFNPISSPQQTNTATIALTQETYAPGANRFIGVSVETYQSYWRIWCEGPHNLWQWCRFEEYPSGLPSRVMFNGNQARHNVVDFGRWAETAEFFEQNGASGNSVLSLDGMKYRMTIGSKPLLWLENMSGSSNPVLNVFNAGAGTLSTNANTPDLYRFSLSANATKWKAQADSGPRLQIDNGTGTISAGPGDGTLDVNLYRNGADRWQTDDTFRAEGGLGVGAWPTSPYGLAIGGGTGLFRVNSTSGAVDWNNTGTWGLRLNNLTTAQRDALTGVPVGAHIFNTTAGQVQTWNGSAWISGGGGGGGSSSGPAGAIQLSDGSGGFSSAANGLPALSWKESSQQLIATNAVVGKQLLVGKTTDTTGRPIVINQNSSNNGLRLEYNAAGTTWSELSTANDGALVLNTSQGSSPELRVGTLTIPSGIQLTGTAQTGVQTIEVTRLTTDPTAPPNNTALLYAWPNEITPYLFVKHSDGTAVPIGAVIHFPDTVDVVNTTAETTILEWTVPGNLLGADRSIQIDMGGDLLNNSGSNDTITFNVKYGTTTLISRTTGALGTSTPNRSWRLNGFLANKTVSSQVAVIDVRISATGSGAGFGSFAGITSDGQAGGTSALDSSVARDLVITVQHSVANANTRISRLYAKLRIE